METRRGGTLGGGRFREDLLLAHSRLERSAAKWLKEGAASKPREESARELENRISLIEDSIALIKDSKLEPEEKLLENLGFEWKIVGYEELIEFPDKEIRVPVVRSRQIGSQRLDNGKPKILRVAVGQELRTNGEQKYSLQKNGTRKVNNGKKKTIWVESEVKSDNGEPKTIQVKTGRQLHTNGHDKQTYQKVRTETFDNGEEKTIEVKVGTRKVTNGRDRKIWIQDGVQKRTNGVPSRTLQKTGVRTVDNGKPKMTMQKVGTRMLNNGQPKLTLQVIEIRTINNGQPRLIEVRTGQRTLNNGRERFVRQVIDRVTRNNGFPRMIRVPDGTELVNNGKPRMIDVEEIVSTTNEEPEYIDVQDGVEDDQTLKNDGKKVVVGYNKKKMVKKVKTGKLIQRGVDKELSASGEDRSSVMEKYPDIQPCSSLVDKPFSDPSGSRFCYE